jgi:hypothetical protein
MHQMCDKLIKMLNSSVVHCGIKSLIKSEQDYSYHYTDTESVRFETNDGMVFTISVSMPKNVRQVIEIASGE